MKKAIRWILLAVCLAVFCVAAYQLYTIFFGYQKARAYYKSTASQYVETAAGAEETMPAEPAAGETASAPEAPLRAPISVDFEQLLADCGDVVGWIYGPGTDINYPVVQGEDNDYYLHRMMDGTSSSNGTIFMDAGNAAALTDGNTFLYGHNMKDGSMFCSLVDYGDQDYYEEHPVLYYLTPQGNYQLQLFAGLTVPADSWIYTLDFAAEGEKAAYIAQAVANSSFQSDVTATAGDQLMTLSTCTYTYDDARYVVLGVLLPIS